MAKRIVTSLIGIAILLAVLLLDNLDVMRIAIGIICLCILYELYEVFGYIKNKAIVIIGIISTVCTVFANKLDIRYFIPLALAYVIVLAVLSIVSHKKVTFTDVTRLFFMTMYVPFFMMTIFFIRNHPHGEFLIWLVFGGAWLTDTFAFFVGRYLGKTKLCPDISPKKTVEGAIGGMAGTVVLFLLYGFVLNHYFNIGVHFINLAVLSVLASAAAQIGDLTASVIKREMAIKDFGTAMPGHGGFLDRFDSVLFTAPVIYALLFYFKIFN